MKDGNESLYTMGLSINLQDDDSYIDTEVKEGETSAIDETEISTFTT